jgi:hypothetical protein
MRNEMKILFELSEELLQVLIKYSFLTLKDTQRIQHTILLFQSYDHAVSMGRFVLWDEAIVIIYKICALVEIQL